MAYLLEPSGKELAAAVIGGAPPAMFAMPERMAVDAPYASAAAWRTGKVIVFGEPVVRPADAGLARLVPFPYSVASAPVATHGRRLGALTVIRLPSRDGAMTGEQSERLRRNGDRLANGLAPLVERGGPLPMMAKPVLIPVFGARRAATSWGLPEIPGSTGLTMAYRVYKFSAALTQAGDIPNLRAAVRVEMMSACGAGALLLAAFREGRMWVVEHAGVSSETVRALHGRSASAWTPLADSLRRWEPTFFPDSAGLFSRYREVLDDGHRAWALLPLTHHGRPTGICCLGFDKPHTFDPEEQATMMMMADLLGAALDQALVREHEHALAETLQRQLLPRVLSDFPEATFTARYAPASVGAGVGGDWYDMLRLPGGRLGLVVGDVEGHSIESSVVMGQLRSAVLAYAREGHTPADILTKTSHILVDLDTDMLATCCFMRLDVLEGTAELALAGHLAPVLLRPGGQVTDFGAPANVPLGVNDPAIPPYEGAEATIEPNSLLLFYTDGLVQNPSDDPMPDVRALLNECTEREDHDLEELADRIISLVPDPPERYDDAVLLLARYDGTPSGSPWIDGMEVQRHDLQGVKTARRFIRDCLTSWNLDAFTGDMELMASEVVTNALIHADSAVDVRLRARRNRIRLEVRDSEITPPVPSVYLESREDNAQAEHGRGLLIVDALASSWGSSPTGRGKTVWVEMSL
ncbi:SpoIIE family protein phosphatase [Streptomyces massasporeus]|uniref:ATP-binding SpoIIE family protein phosphatase n=1 Tax=Streptomyces massasporeus TaxID=67324 RepID=UPI0037AB33F7